MYVIRLCSNILPCFTLTKGAKRTVLQATHISHSLFSISLALGSEVIKHIKYGIRW